MKVKRDTITGLVGLTWSVIWFILIQVQTTQPANLLEPGPRLLPYVGLIVVFLSSLMLTIKGIKDWKKIRNRTPPTSLREGKRRWQEAILCLSLQGF